MAISDRIPNMEPVIIEHEELQLVGIPCISLTNMSSKYHNAKESLLSSMKYFPQVVDREIHYGIWPTSDTQKSPERHAYILCVEVSTFEGIPDWYLKINLPKQKCVVVANDRGDFDAASNLMDVFLKQNKISVSAEGETTLFVKNIIIKWKASPGIHYLLSNCNNGLQAAMRAISECRFRTSEPRRSCS